MSGLSVFFFFFGLNGFQFLNDMNFSCPMHYCDVTWASWLLKSPAARMFIQRLGKPDIKRQDQSSALMVLCDIIRRLYTYVITCLISRWSWLRWSIMNIDDRSYSIIEQVDTVRSEIVNIYIFCRWGTLKIFNQMLLTPFWDLLGSLDVQ